LRSTLLVNLRAPILCWQNMKWGDGFFVNLMLWQDVEKKYGYLFENIWNSGSWTMQYVWYIEYALVVICTVVFVGWMLWLLRSRHDWSSGLAIKFVGTIVLVALFWFPYNILCNPQIWKELFSGDFTSPHILIFLLVWIWMPSLWMFWESALIYFIARRAKRSEQPKGLLKAIILISPSPVLGWLTATPQLAYLGHWTFSECAILILGGVVLSSLFPLISYLMLEPVVKRRFGRSAEFEGLGRRLSVTTWILFVNVVICTIGVLLKRGTSFNNSVSD
jgi:hypothetical protein